MMEELLSKLNEPQREAVLDTEHNLLVFAGAGSGKTRVITTKIAYAASQCSIPPYRILAVTFTNKACKEMKQRIETMIPEIDSKSFCIFTFHSFCAWCLRKYGERVGLKPNFKIYDEDDSAALLAQACPGDRKLIRAAAKKISALKDKMEKPDPKDSVLLNQYYAYEKRLAETGNVDFADLILKTIELFDTDKEAYEWVRGRFKLVLVDEYQDSNVAQFELLQRIHGDNQQLCVVGDDDQSIYRFRGAEVQNILSFDSVFPNTRVIKLEQNYRSTQAIIDLAGAVISHNTIRAQKKLWTNNPKGQLPVVIYKGDQNSMVFDICDRIMQHGAGDSAILYRTNAQSSVFEREFIRRRIPHQIVGALRFYEREEVKDIVSMLSLLLNPSDSVGFARIINKPPRGIGETSQEKILQIAQDQAKGDCIAACRLAVEQKAIATKTTNAVSEFLKAYDHIEGMLDLIPNSSVVSSLIDEFGFLEYYKAQDKEINADSKKVDNLEALVNTFKTQGAYEAGRDGFNAFMEEAMLDPTRMASQMDEGGSGVTLITMHNTKGLEFDKVFIVGMEEGLFPSDSHIEDERDIEEERRILYVAITRARKELYIYSCAQTMMWGQTQYREPSRFLKEFPENMVSVIKPQRPSFSGLGYSSRGWDRDEDRGYGYGNADSQSPYGGYRKRTLFSEQKRKPESKGPAFVPLKGYKAPTPSPAAPAAPARLSAISCEYSAGDRIESDAYGKGTVKSIRSLGGRTVLDVHFDSGKTLAFVSDKVSFRKI